MLSSCVCHDFPVVNAFREADISEQISENVFVFLEINGSAVWADLNQLLGFLPWQLLEDRIFNVPVPV